VAGKEEACSHVAALLFYMEDFICQQNAGDSMLTSIPEDRTATDELQCWHVPPKRSISSKRMSDITFEKASYGKVRGQTSTNWHHNNTLETLPTQSQKSGPSLAQLLQDVKTNFPSRGLLHFWIDACQSQPVVSDSLDTNDIQIGLMLLVEKLIVTTTTPYIYEDTMTSSNAEYFQEIFLRV
jgi:hypothetical protein